MMRLSVKFLLLILMLAGCLLVTTLAAQTRPEGDECRPEEVDMGDYCASLPPAQTESEKDRRRVTHFRRKGMMPGKVDSSGVSKKDKNTLVPQKTEVGAPQKPVGKIDGFLVQLGAFSTREAAQSVAASVESPHTPVMIIPLERGDRILWSCAIGPFPDRKSADAVRDQMRENKKFRTAFVTTSSSETAKTETSIGPVNDSTEK